MTARWARQSDTAGVSGTVIPQGAGADPRMPARHDRDRLIYSRSLLRLGGVTQVLTPDATAALTHNRLTHTIKVAQVARAIAEKIQSQHHHADAVQALGGLDADVAEAAALAHDLGHAPFGHIGEVVLDRVAREQWSLTDGFEGNAQSFRILTRVEPRSTDFIGIDATAATRSAVLKYPWARPPGDAQETLPKFGYYADDTEAATSARLWLSSGYPKDAQTLEAAVMDVADDITYALHDLEDFRFVGLLSPSGVCQELVQWRDVYAASLRQKKDASDENHWIGRLRRRLKTDLRYDDKGFIDAVTAVSQHLTLLGGSSGNTWRLIQENSREFISSSITQWLQGLELRVEPDRHNPPLYMTSAIWLQVAILKQVTRDYIINRPDVAAVQRGQQRLLEELLRLLDDWMNSEDKKRAPAELVSLYEHGERRGILDYVASLGDQQALNLHGLLTGRGSQTVVNQLAL